MLRHSIARSALVLLLTCSTGAPGRASEAELFNQLGGLPGIQALVDGTLRHSLDDPRIKASFDDTNIDRLKGLLTSQFCALSGGPCIYKGRTMLASHAALGIKARQMDALVEDMQLAMAEQHIPFPTQNRLLALLAPMRDEVVSQ